MARSTTRTLWLAFTLCLAMALVGAAILFNPTLEFLALDLIQKLHLPLGPVANLAFYAEAALFLTSTIGLVTMTVRHLLARHVR